MTNSVQFNVGGRVVCVDGFLPGFNGEEGTVSRVWESKYGAGPMIEIQFDKDEVGELREWRARRFVHASPDSVALSPVCRKIRKMEERWKRFQDGKKASKLDSSSCGNISTYVTLDEAVTVAGISIYATLDHRF